MENLEQPKDAVEWLRQEYVKRRTRNPSYSLRAFSRALHIPSGRISELFARKRTLTPALATRIARELSLSNEQQQDFFALLPAAQIKWQEEDNLLVSLNVDSAKVPQAKEIIENFRKSFVELMGEVTSTDVHNLRILLIPTSKKNKRAV